MLRYFNFYSFTPSLQGCTVATVNVLYIYHDRIFLLSELKEITKVQKKQKVGLVLLNMGGPPDLDSVRPFLYQLFSDPTLIKLPRFIRFLQKPLAWLIAKFRAPATKKMYQAIGNGSPIRTITEDLAQLLENELKSMEIDAKVVVAMRYTEPRATMAIETLEKHGTEKIILFSQYPHYADSTTGSSLSDFYNYLHRNETLQLAEVIEIEDWGLENEYVQWWVNKVRDKIDKSELKDGIHVIFSAHGLPQRYIDQGETYPERLQLTVDEIVERLERNGQVTYHLAYQSKAGPFPWTQPYTEDVLKEIAVQDPSLVIMVPLGFVSNHVETLYEIDILYAGQAKELGIKNFDRVEVPDADPSYAKGITHLILRKLEGGFN
jgi:ferrochelatase